MEINPSRIRNFRLLCDVDACYEAGRSVATWPQLFSRCWRTSPIAKLLRSELISRLPQSNDKVLIRVNAVVSLSWFLHPCTHEGPFTAIASPNFHPQSLFTPKVHVSTASNGGQLTPRITKLELVCFAQSENRTSQVVGFSIMNSSFTARNSTDQISDARGNSSLSRF